MAVTTDKDKLPCQWRPTLMVQSTTRCGSKSFYNFEVRFKVTLYFKFYNFLIIGQQNVKKKKPTQSTCKSLWLTEPLFTVFERIQGREQNHIGGQLKSRRIQCIGNGQKLTFVCNTSVAGKLGGRRQLLEVYSCAFSLKAESVC